MKRFLVFAGEAYYPLGGWNDFRSSFDTKEEAFAAKEVLHSAVGWVHVVDSETQQIVKVSR